MSEDNNYATSPTIPVSPTLTLVTHYEMGANDGFGTITYFHLLEAISPSVAGADGVKYQWREDNAGGGVWGAPVDIVGTPDANMLTPSWGQLPPTNGQSLFPELPG